MLSVEPEVGNWLAQVGDVSVRHELDLDQSPGSVQSWCATQKLSQMV